MGTRAPIARVRSELGVVVDELRDLANGIHPAVLSQVGLDQGHQVHGRALQHPH